MLLLKEKRIVVTRDEEGKRVRSTDKLHNKNQNSDKRN
jgi:hypothetical protein